MMILSLTAGLAACGGSAGEGSQDAAKDVGVQRYAWPLGSSSPEDTVTQIYAEKFADEVDRLSDGKMKISVYPNSVLGGDRELLESCKDGDIPFVVQNTAPQVTFMKD
ncbi:MAG: C4-dicarboxylate ABC transporter, partial [Agathobacter rectalis]